MNTEIKMTIEAMLQPFLNKAGFDLIDLEYVKEGGHWFLRIYIDKAGGIDIDDCGKVSEYLSAKLDEADPISGAYFLEVSSPGAERPMKQAKDYYLAINKHVFITTYEAVDGLKEFEGTLLSFDEQNVVIEVNKSKYVLPYSIVASGRLAIVF